MDLTTLVSGHLGYLGLGSPLIGNLNFNRTTGAGLALGQGTAASPTAARLLALERSKIFQKAAALGAATDGLRAR